VGGTEVYVEALAREQLVQGLEVVVAAPGVENASYAIDGLEVRRFATGSVENLAALYGAGDSLASAQFGSVLDNERPDIVHLHAFTGAVSVRTVDEAHRRGNAVVFTYHTPTVSCQRGTLLWHGRRICDGRLQVQRCAECALQGLGAGRIGSAVLSRVPTKVGDACNRLDLTGSRIWTGVRYSQLVATQHAAVRALMARVQRVVVLCDWARDVLLGNGVAPEKVLTCRHGLSYSDPAEGPVRRSGPLRVAFLGRLHPTKGPDILVHAMRLLEGAPLEVHLFGIQQPGDEAYADRLRASAVGDPRIVFRPSVPQPQVLDVLGDFDVLAVPSQWLETGPLVVLEAFAARVPVIGSRLGGIAELVQDGVDGLLPPHDSVGQWARALGRLASDRALVLRLRGNVRPPRRMRAVADEMLSAYADITSSTQAVAA
jgi:glycosyltransferase involved in cell wall biosynthesis